MLKNFCMPLLFILVLFSNFNKATPTSGTADENHPSFLSPEEHDKGRGVRAASRGAVYDEIRERFTRVERSLATKYIAEVRSEILQGYHALEVDAKEKLESVEMQAVDELIPEFHRLPEDWQDTLTRLMFEAAIEALRNALSREIWPLVTERQIDLRAEFSRNCSTVSEALVKEAKECLSWSTKWTPDVGDDWTNRFVEAVHYKDLSPAVQLALRDAYSYWRQATYNALRVQVEWRRGVIDRLIGMALFLALITIVLGFGHLIKRLRGGEVSDDRA
jgi:hypothetical protein